MALILSLIIYIYVLLEHVMLRIIPTVCHWMRTYWGEKNPSMGTYGDIHTHRHTRAHTYIHTLNKEMVERGVRLQQVSTKNSNTQDTKLTGFSTSASLLLLLHSFAGFPPRCVLQWRSCVKQTALWPKQGPSRSRLSTRRPLFFHHTWLRRTTAPLCIPFISVSLSVCSSFVFLSRPSRAPALPVRPVNAGPAAEVQPALLGSLQAWGQRSFAVSYWCTGATVWQLIDVGLTMPFVHSFTVAGKEHVFFPPGLGDVMM